MTFDKSIIHYSQHKLCEILIKRQKEKLREIFGSMHWIGQYSKITEKQLVRNKNAAVLAS